MSVKCQEGWKEVVDAHIYRFLDDLLWSISETIHNWLEEILPDADQETLSEAADYVWDHIEERICGCK